mgnify:CR=1 FL=1
MEKVIYNLVFNRKKRLNAEGKALIQVEAYLNRQKKYFSTKIYVKPTQWDSKRKAVRNHPNMDELNQYIEDYITYLERIELDMVQSGRPFSLKYLRERGDFESVSSSFVSFMKNEINHSNLRLSTLKNHLSTLQVLCQYQPQVSFDDLTFNFLCGFEHFLLEQKYHRNTIAKHMKHLKRYVNVAINKEYMDIQKYAFRKYKIKSIEGSHTHLSPEELNKMEEVNLEGKFTKLQKSKDAFLFCCYAGLRYSDFINLTAANIVELHQETWLIYKSVKTGIDVRLPLYLLFEGKGLRVLENYKDDLNGFFKLKDNSNVNKDLNALAKLAEIDKRISFHTARHTNATLLIYSGANITTVQKLLGHKSVKTTQVYANIMDMTIVHDLEKAAYSKLANRPKS